MDASLLVRLILLLPLAGALFNGLVPLFAPSLRKSEGLIGTVGTAVVAIPFALAGYLFLTVGGEPIVVDFYTWMAAGDLSLDFAYRVDQLSLIMTLIVTGVGGVIHFYSVGYMHGDDGFWRFFAFLNLFIFTMLNLVLGNNLPVLFLGWEGVGLCSYLLIGFWYTELSNGAAANKAFIVNRIGDFAFLMAMFLLFRELGSLDFDVLLEEGPVTLSSSTINWAVLLLFIGATGKSAQIPLFVWLPDAMAGPTPVSALIHAATMVTSGLYLLARLSPLVLNAPVMMAVIAIVGALTAFMAATIAIVQYDIKKVLAYSTVSQLGFMFMAAGVGAFFVAIFHVLTHAFFKGCLFLASGSVIHAMHDVEHELEDQGVIPFHRGPQVPATPLESEAEQDTLRHSPLPYDGPFDAQDMRSMGNLGRFMPSTSATYLISTFAISGIPLFAGFFSKDEILFRAFEFGYNGYGYAWMVWIVGVVTALLTAFYITRSYMLSFRGTPRWPRSDTVHPQESPTTMTAPLWILAGLATIGGFIGLPGVVAHGEWNWIHHYLGAPYGGPVAEPELTAHVPLAAEWGLIALGTVIAIGGVVWAWRSYSAYELAYDEKLQARFGAFYEWWRGKYFWDEAYDRTVVRPIIEGSRRGLWPFDDYVVDGAVNGLARLAQGTSGVLRRLQTGIVQNYALAIVLGVAVVIGLMLLG